MRKLHWLIFLTINILFTVSCTEDEGNGPFTKEPNIRFQSNTTINYEKVFGIGGDGNIALSGQARDFDLPIDLSRDTTVYVFEQSTIPNDTLTISYAVEVNRFGTLSGCQSEKFSVSIINLQIVENQTTFNSDEISVSLN